MIVLFEEPPTKEKVYFQIQKFLLEKSASFIQIVEVCDVEKTAVDEYLNQLIDSGNVVLKPKRKQGIDKFALTDKGRETITLLLEKQKVKTQIDQMPPEKFEQFKKFLDFMAKSKKDDEFILHLSGDEASKKFRKFKNLGTIEAPKD